jgi:hypothetical protein
MDDSPRIVYRVDAVAHDRRGHGASHHKNERELWAKKLLD